MSCKIAQQLKDQADEAHPINEHQRRLAPHSSIEEEAVCHRIHMLAAEPEAVGHVR